jgi:signal transduction histidine kinase
MFPTTVTVAPVEAELQVRVDHGALGTMLGVVLRQAAAASPAGGEVMVAARTAGARVVVEVRDQGPGCARRDLPSLLRPFAPGSEQVAGRCAGSGLELPIARLLAKASGGSLTLRSSQAAGGMTAVLSLPRA